MKIVCFHRLILLFSASFFIFSCAKPGVAPRPRTDLPPNNLPGIGGQQPPSSMEKYRPVIVENMIAKAKKQLGQNRPEAAFQTLERALAIDGNDPMVWHLMAGIRMAQADYAQAESLAQKSNTLAAGDFLLKEKNRRIILDARGKWDRTE